MNETKTSDDLIRRRDAIEVVTLFSGYDAITAIRAIPSAPSDLSDYSDKLWRAAYERGKAEGYEQGKADGIKQCENAELMAEIGEEPNQ